MGTFRCGHPKTAENSYLVFEDAGEAGVCAMPHMRKVESRRAVFAAAHRAASATDRLLRSVLGGPTCPRWRVLAQCGGQGVRMRVRVVNRMAATSAGSGNRMTRLIAWAPITAKGKRSRSRTLTRVTPGQIARVRRLLLRGAALSQRDRRDEQGVARLTAWREELGPHFVCDHGRAPGCCEPCRDIEAATGRPTEFREQSALTIQREARRFPLDIE